MRNWQPMVRCVGVVAAITAIAGCTTQGQATSESAASGQTSEPSVDVAALDTGNYPTDPRPAFGKATQDNILQVEGQRMAQFVVVPFEIDEDLTNANLPTMVITGQNSLGPVFPADIAKVPANKNMLMGFVGTAATPDEKLRTGAKSVSNMVLRYATAGDAAAAARQMADATAASDKVRTTTLPGLPDTHVVRTNSGGNSQMMAFTAHNTYVLYQWYETPPTQQVLQEPTIRKAIALQTALIDKFPATPTKNEAKARGITGSSAPVIDQNHVLIYALPYSDEDLKKGQNLALPGASIRAVYGPRGMAQMSGDPKTDFTLLTDVGSTANAVEKSTVYRATAADGAKKIVDTSLASNRSQGWADAPSPAGLPIAKCQSKTLESGTWYLCYVQKGRYVGTYSAPNPKDVQQAISAQYVILTKADQNAN
ncbi:hypothetical protein GTV32_19070 [Gordonia sp. SID5947]|uniref:DUF7373 family lipoprotein n=1 Tax=Gordonia sp. SID5947 TaxID=2690315 RepID=UPI00136BC4EA|nr:hypothetical protein [Gordonia sp. SID5947]MYR08269.1 hypothetical protein [Gordonia sp. SID5947]